MKPSNASRWIVRTFFLLTALVMVLDVIPPTDGWLARPKAILSSVLTRFGLWQGQWSMFAPDPVLNNAVFIAEIRDVEGNVFSWTSPDWRDVTGLQKFVRIREMNYFNKLHHDFSRPALSDFADHLARSLQPARAAQVTLYRESMQIVMPDDSSLPVHDEEIWVSRRDFLITKRYDP